MPTVYEELSKAAKCIPSAGQDFEDFARELTKKVNELPDTKWEALSKDAQDWQNEAVTKLNDKRTLKKEGKADEAEAVEIPVLEGYEDVPAKAEKPAKPAKAAKPAKDANSGKRGRPGKYPESAVITVLKKENPHRPGTNRHKRWAHLKNKMTVKSALAAGLSPRNLRHFVEEGHISIAA